VGPNYFYVDILRFAQPFTPSFYSCATNVDPDQPAFWSEITLINQKANIEDPDQTARTCQLIWFYTVHPCHKGVNMVEKVKSLLVQELC
jgi:hypothetical protein